MIPAMVGELRSMSFFAGHKSYKAPHKYEGL